MNKENTKQAILGFTEFFKGITGNEDLKIPDDIAKEYEIKQDDISDNDKYDEFGFFNPFNINDEKNEDDINQSETEIDFIQPKKIVGKLISINMLNKIRYEVLEYIDDLDIAAEICDIFDKYESEIEDT